MPNASVFHEGELTLQRHAGSAAMLAEIGSRVVRDQMPQQHRQFFAQLPFLVLGALDATGQPWATLLAGPPGFAAAPDARHLRVDALPAQHDALHAALRPGAPVGLLGIEPHTRRRNRMNGRVDAVDGQGFDVEVDQSFGNCPKYIQARQAQYATDAAFPAGGSVAAGLDDAARRLVAQSDTFFIASAHPLAAAGTGSHGLDVSHRGGRPGFVKVAGNTLTVPDFTGNAFFNTLGNLLLHPRCGLLFVDFAAGGLLQVAAHAEIVTGGAELRSFAGAERLLRLQVQQVRQLPGVVPLRWTEAALSPHLAGTGNWPARSLAAARSRAVQESACVLSAIHRA